ncbi:26S proteasome non-ATPase regulatory subunit [Wickerhamomyces ciferrii]|uniref:26S proteasome non-ATPase regulatory subunit n=1 Tax=Wickerhamomyces ciferrii (strain ATCC 14091 / BCRC 22168 / CBS 111 / JCM 3599 / NBRC 0793 / NRRL Y-1031 F-60-10) TaxID=1206466 RepID=K0KM95_WICCF|nr:26S proteasome non-ATPase regulatory subunit [Wickerhamomyces ciferrii]CCH43307.1 26S proteasome non-ATPase regulatory subunit [Wickerhamomyces ciferrii]
MPSLEDLTKQLKSAFDSKHYEKSEELLSPIKILLIQNELLIPNFKRTSDPHYVEDLVISRSVLEIGALSAINLQNFDKFENYLQQLKVFYFNTVNNEQLSKSINKSKLISLYLLLLLAKGDVVKFHTELEFLGNHLKNIENDLYLSYPIKIENWLLEGYYDKAWELISNTNSEEKVKLKEFNIFNETLLLAIRFEISRSIEKTYKELPFVNAKYLLFLNNEKEVENFAKDQEWNFKNGVLYFNNNLKESKFAIGEEDDDDLKLNNSEKLVKNTLNYAREIDSII